MPKLTDEQIDELRKIYCSPLSSGDKANLIDTIDDLKAQLTAKDAEITELIVKGHGAKLAYFSACNADLDFRQQVRELAENWGNDAGKYRLLALPGMKYSQEDV